jgi:hypothetical protein|nr:MAG TPA: hypothetical protein [Caudoviricetes sp.]
MIFVINNLKYDTDKMELISDECVTVNAKILHDEYMRGYRKGYQEGRDVIVGTFDDKMKELKNEIAEEEKK